jgi:hypothetical protein
MVEFKEAIRSLGTLLSSQASIAGYSFHLVGIAVDWEVSAGLRYLRDLGEFDEISSGGKWLNTAVSERLFTESRPSVPSVVLCQRTITAVPESGTMVFTHERELLRMVGAKQIAEWAYLGAPIADLLDREVGK